MPYLALQAVSVATLPAWLATAALLAVGAVLYAFARRVARATE